MDFQTRDYTDITGYPDREVDTHGCISVGRYREEKPLIRANGIEISNNCTPARVSATLNRGATDPEHDRAYCFMIPVVGLEVDRFGKGYIVFRGHIEPQNGNGLINGAGNLKVPPPDFTPFENAGECDADACDDHPIVDYGFIEHNQELFEKIEGLYTTITIPTC